MLYTTLLSHYDDVAVNIVNPLWDQSMLKEERKKINDKFAISCHHI